MSKLGGGKNRNGWKFENPDVDNLEIVRGCEDSDFNVALLIFHLLSDNFSLSNQENETIKERLLRSLR